MEGKAYRSECSHIGHSENVSEQKYVALADTHGFSPAEIGSLDALCSSFFPSLPFEARSLRASELNFKEEVYQFYQASTQVVGLGPLKVAETMKEIVKPAELQILRQVLWLLSTSVGTLALAGRFSLTSEFPFIHRFGDLSAEKREQVLLSWSTSSLLFFRTVFKAFKTCIMLNHFTRVNEKGNNPLWKGIGYCGPDPVAMSSQLSPKPLSNSVIDVSCLYGDDLDAALEKSGCTLANASHIAALAGTESSPQDHAIECDVVIAGSGCGGGVAAAVLANAGFKVVIVEKGGYSARHDLSLLERQSYKQLYEERGVLATDDKGVVVLAGSGVGGGTAINWSASFRTPDHVLREWSQESKLELFASQKYQDAMDQVCKRIGVQGEVTKDSFQNAVLRKGCENLGYDVSTIPRNAPPDHYCGWCNLGCRRGIKQATSETWLVDAAKAGAVILTRCNVDKVLHMQNQNSSGSKPRKAIGVMAKVQGRHLFIKSRATVVASGSLNTPPLLHRSELKNPHIGKNLHMHPVQICWGYFPEGDGTCYEGGIMSAFSKEAANWDSSGYGALIQTPIMHPGSFASAIPWKSGSDFKKGMARYSRTAQLIVLVRDKGSGRVGSNRDGSLKINYKIRDDDEQRALEGMEKALRVLVAAGAVEIGVHHPGLGSFNVEEKSSGAEFEDYVKEVTGKRGAQLYSAHQLGSCRMGRREEESAVDEMCESWEVEGLFVADGSALPTASGVNPMVTIQSIAYCTANNVVDYLSRQPM
eukprot:Gb_37040 [translate_table: standard]